MIEARHAFTAIAACLILTGATAAIASGLGDIVNYREYSADLSSSGQPTETQLQAVADSGFERVVFLAFTDHDESLANEDRLVKGLGMEYAQIPISTSGS